VAPEKVRNRCITRCRGNLILCGTRRVVSVLAEKALSRAQVGLALRRLLKQSLTMKQVLSVKSGEAYVFPSSPIREQRPIFLGRTHVSNLTIQRHGRQESQVSRDPGAIFAAVDQEASRGAHHSPLHWCDCEPNNHFLTSYTSCCSGRLAAIRLRSVCVFQAVHPRRIRHYEASGRQATFTRQRQVAIKRCYCPARPSCQHFRHE